MNKSREQKPMRAPSVKSAAIYAFYINLLIYLLFLVMFIYGRSAVLPLETDHPRPPAPTGWMLVYGVVSTYLFVFSLFCINFYIQKQDNWRSTAKTGMAILVSLVFIFVWNRLMLSLQGAIFDLGDRDPHAARGSMMRDVVLGAFVIFSAQLTYLSYRRQVMTIENETLRAEYERARYEALKNQVDPHFLFNTLNTLSSVIGNDPQMARRYVQKLSSIFRYTIQSRDVTTLEEELAFTKDYCDLMQIRYMENLNFEFDILGKYHTYNVVPFSIQTLVENAIKHNVISDKQPLTITIYTDDDHVVVSNPVNLKKEQGAGEGIGLSNLSERYKLKWGEDIIIRSDDSVFTVRLPLIPVSQG